MCRVILALKKIDTHSLKYIADEAGCVIINFNEQSYDGFH